MHVLRKFLFAAVSACTLTFSAGSQAAFILEIDTDGLDDGNITFNPGFSYGGDTNVASQSVPSNAYGMSGGDSIFGGNGSLFPDTYVYTYTPSTDSDNLAIPQGTDLGGGNLASGIAGGGIGNYRVYATWPYTENVGGGLTTYTITTSGAADVIVGIDQNGAGHEWILLGDIFFSDALASIQVTQQSGVNSFVSMRAAGLLFEKIDAERVPEPSTLALLGLGLAGISYRRRRNKQV